MEEMIRVRKIDILDVEFDKRVVDILSIVLNHYNTIRSYSATRTSDIHHEVKIKLHKNQSLIVSIRFQQLIVDDRIVYLFTDKLAGFDIRDCDYVRFLGTIKNLYGIVGEF